MTEGTTGGTTGGAAPGVTAGTAFGSTDIAWTQLMVVLDDRALRVLDLVPDRSGDPENAGFAARLAIAHHAELGRLRQLLARAAVPATNPHEGHNMPGMATPEQLAALSAATGAAFDRLLLARLREHLEQCVLLARGEQRGGRNTATKVLAATVETTRRRDLAHLAALSRAG